MKNADTMFEELGYTKKETDYDIEYSNEKEILEFYKKSKTIAKMENVEEFEELAFADITMQELKAINQKCKELRVGGRQ